MESNAFSVRRSCGLLSPGYVAHGLTPLTESAYKRREALRGDLTQPPLLADLLNHFYGYVEPHIQVFEEAVEQFKEEVPRLAHGLADKLKAAHEDNANFQAAQPRSQIPVWERRSAKLCFVLWRYCGNVHTMSFATDQRNSVSRKWVPKRELGNGE